jgi:hypothetical protein
LVFEVPIGTRSTFDIRISFGVLKIIITLILKIKKIKSKKSFQNHFLPECFYFNNGRQRIHDDAIPTVFDPDDIIRNEQAHICAKYTRLEHDSGQRQETLDLRYLNSFAFNYRSHYTKIVLFCVHAKWILAV